MPGYGQFLDLNGAEKAGLVKHCRFSASQLEKIYRTQATTAHALSSVTMLQTYQPVSGGALVTYAS